ncbi:fimbrillin family protein [Alistipes sp.]|uniref:fimbrillin family protein n=1 Tax=Alistipes sp. TaxID=1872444 RepID=UPI0025BA46B4|nr:fimbrillin family protein [Alistipes sp.]
MKKITFLLVGAALALAACSKTETVNGPSVDAIGFDGAYIGNPTDSRAVTTIDNSISTFQVYGQYTKDGAQAVKVFGDEKGGVEVSKQTSGSWTYTGGLRPWIEGAAYVFAGYAPKNAAAPKVNAEGYLTWENYDVSANQYDLIYASQTATGQKTGNQQVGFTFNHLLSIVGFTFKSGFDANTKLTISNVTVNSVPSTATFTPDNSVTASGNIGGSWGAASDPKNYSLTIAAITEAEGSSSNNFFAIPQAVPSIEVSFNVMVTTLAGEELVNSKSFTTKVPVGTVTKWNPGYKYNYVATITPESLELEYIQFGDPTVTNWEEAADETLPLQ